MKIALSSFGLILLSFTAPMKSLKEAKAPNVNVVKTVAPPSDSLSLKNFKMPAISSENENEPVVAEKKEKKVSGKSMTGIASYYSANLEGSKTSTGERFSHSKANVASNFFKLNTWVKVTSLSNGKSIVARVNDRMHPRMAAKGRVVDLTREHAKHLGFLKNGLTKVKIEEVPAGTKE